MQLHLNKNTIIPSLFIIFIFSISLSKTLYAAETSKNFIVNGEIAKYWSGSIGNGLKYGIQIIDQQAKTKRKNLVVSQGEKKVEGDALKIKWKGKVIKNEWGSGNVLHDSVFSIGGPKVDLSAYVDTHAIILNIKVHKAPKRLTTYGMECNWSKDCRPSIPINAALKKLPKKEWTNFPIPLACFNKNGFDFKQLTGPLTISTQGSLNIELANVYLAEIPEAHRGCR